MKLAELPFDALWEIMMWCDEPALWRLSFMCKALREAAEAARRFPPRVISYREYVECWESGRLFTLGRAIKKDLHTLEGQLQIAIFSGYLGGHRGRLLMKFMPRNEAVKCHHLEGRAQREWTPKFDEYLDICPFSILAGLARSGRRRDFGRYFHKMINRNLTLCYENMSMSYEDSRNPRYCYPFYKDVLYAAVSYYNLRATRILCRYLESPFNGLTLYKKINRGYYCNCLIEFCIKTGDQWSPKEIATFDALHSIVNFRNFRRLDSFPAGCYILCVAVENNNPGLFYHMVIGKKYVPKYLRDHNIHERDKMRKFLKANLELFEKWAWVDQINLPKWIRKEAQLSEN